MVDGNGIHVVTLNSPRKGSGVSRTTLNPQPTKTPKLNNQIDRFWRAVVYQLSTINHQQDIYGEFDPGSGRTLAACLRNASRAGQRSTERVQGIGYRVSG